MTNGQNTDLYLASKVLSELKPNIATSDILKCPWSQPTVHRYLSGGGKKLDLATEMIEYFRSKIEERRKIIAA